MEFAALCALVAELSALVAFALPIIKRLKKADKKIAQITEGTRCQLRSEMLRTYYRHRETEIIRQYEFENFMLLYEAYKALNGNSFIDKIKKEVETWEVIS